MKSIWLVEYYTHDIIDGYALCTKNHKRIERIKAPQHDRDSEYFYSS